jgi:hypothetical protein
MKSALAATLVVLLGSTALGLGAAALIAQPGCTPAERQAIVTDITPAGACIAQQLLSGGVEDPVQIAAACIGTTIADVVQVTETLIAYANAQSDAAPTTQAHLSRVLARATALQVEASVGQ